MPGNVLEWTYADCVFKVERDVSDVRYRLANFQSFLIYLENDCERTNVGFEQLSKINMELLTHFREETLLWFQRYIDSIEDAAKKESSLYKLANFFFAYAIDKLSEFWN
jgi:hypothetical protein